jgi:hypothetical protein
MRRRFLRCMSPLLACAVQRRRFPVGASPTRQPLQPEATGAVMEVTKWLKPSVSLPIYRLGLTRSSPPNVGRWPEPPVRGGAAI